jgi:hypothetical protein
VKALAQFQRIITLGLQIAGIVGKMSCSCGLAGAFCIKFWLWRLWALDVREVMPLVALRLTVARVIVAGCGSRLAIAGAGSRDGCCRVVGAGAGSRDGCGSRLAIAGGCSRVGCCRVVGAGAGSRDGCGSRLAIAGGCSRVGCGRRLAIAQRFQAVRRMTHHNIRPAAQPPKGAGDGCAVAARGGLCYVLICFVITYCVYVVIHYIYVMA